MKGYELPTFPFRRAPEQDGQQIRHRVAIVGGGLTGLTLACDLALRGVETVVLDEDDTIGVRGIASRGIVYEQRSLDIFDRLGIAERMLETGRTWSVGRVLSGEDELWSFDLASDPTLKHPRFVNIQQYYVEWYLVDRLTELGRTDLRWKNRVTGIAQQADHVALSVETPDGPYLVEADWVVAADGVGSTVRALMDIDTHREGNNDFWCITDVRLKQDVPVERHTWVEAPFNNSKACWKHMMADDVWRLDFQLGQCDIKVEAAPEKAAARAQDTFGDGVDLEVVSVVPWEYYYQLIDDFRHGCVLFAGDAAHAFSSFGGRAGNSGIQDAENLGWKLAAFLKGQAPESLIDTYQEERHPAAAFNVWVTQRSSRFMAPDHPHERRLRDAVLNLAKRHPFGRAMVNTGRLSDPWTYDDSSLTTSGGEAIADRRVGDQGLFDSLSDSTAFCAIWRPAADAPDPLMAALAELADDSAASLETLALCPAPSGLANRLGDAGLTTVADADGAVAASLKLEPGDCLLLRPDRHLAAHIANATAAEITTARDRALGLVEGADH